MKKYNDRPIPEKELEQHFKRRFEVKETPVAIERHFHVSAEKKPKVKTQLERFDRGDGKQHWQEIVDIDGVRAGGGVQ